MDIAENWSLGGMERRLAEVTNSTLYFFFRTDSSYTGNK